jgi:RNase P/RNase MRP subunit POP5
MSLKRLPPSQRRSYRYIKFRVHADQRVELGELVDEIWRASIEFLGVKDSSKADFWTIGNRFDESSQIGIIKVERSMEDDFRAALNFASDFSDKKGFIETKKVSGSLKNL